ncbi:hypothetical protein ACOMHN_039960 [Nucella lapillus]
MLDSTLITSPPPIPSISGPFPPLGILNTAWTSRNWSGHSTLPLNTSSQLSTWTKQQFWNTSFEPWKGQDIVNTPFMPYDWNRQVSLNIPTRPYIGNQQESLNTPRYMPYNWSGQENRNVPIVSKTWNETATWKTKSPKVLNMFFVLYSNLTREQGLRSSQGRGWKREGPRYLHPQWRSMPPLPSWLLTMIGVVMTVVGVMGAVGNIVLIVFLFRCAKLRSSANLYMFNMAAADLLMCLGNFPLLVISAFSGEWVSGFAGCKIYAFIGGVAGFLSINSLTAMACDRYSVISRHKTHWSLTPRQQSLGLTVSLWIYSFFWAVPPFVGWGHFALDGGQISCCFDYLTRSASDVSYIIAIFVFCFGMQVVILIYCYTGIALAIYQYKRHFKPSSSNHSPVTLSHNQRPHHHPQDPNQHQNHQHPNQHQSHQDENQHQNHQEPNQNQKHQDQNQHHNHQDQNQHQNHQDQNQHQHHLCPVVEGEVTVGLAEEDVNVHVLKTAQWRQNRRRVLEVRVTRQVVFITLSFILSWTPFAVVSLIGVFGKASLVTPLVSVLPGIVAKIATVINPVLFAMGHPQYRSILFRYLRRVYARGRSGNTQKRRPRQSSRAMPSSMYFATVLKQSVHGGDCLGHDDNTGSQTNHSLDNVSCV